MLSLRTIGNYLKGISIMTGGNRLGFSLMAVRDMLKPAE